MPEHRRRSAEAGLDPPPTGPQDTGRLLVADDNEMMRMVLKMRLERQGYSADTVENGQLAVDAVGTGAYRAVLMDLQMPVMDGLAAARAIRALPAPLCRVPIIALTGEGEPDPGTGGDGTVIDAYVGKPVDWRSLEAALRKVGAA